MKRILLSLTAITLLAGFTGQAQANWFTDAVKSVCGLVRKNPKLSATIALGTAAFALIAFLKKADAAAHARKDAANSNNESQGTAAAAAKPADAQPSIQIWLKDEYDRPHAPTNITITQRSAEPTPLNAAEFVMSLGGQEQLTLSPNCTYIECSHESLEIPGHNARFDIVTAEGTLTEVVMKRQAGTDALFHAVRKKTQ